jgi:hypothetical protein
MDEAKNQKGASTIKDTMMPAATSLTRNLRLIFSCRIKGTVRRKMGMRYLRREREKA